MIKEYYGCIYKATNLITGKDYIGRTVRGLKKRKGIHLSDSRKENPRILFHRAIKKYGENNFKWEIVEICDNKEDLLAAEIKNIKERKSKVPYGYNLTFGGEGYCPKKLKRKNIKHKKKREGHNKRPVYCTELNLTFNSIKEAANILGICKQGVQQCASGRIRKTRKLSFIYA